MKHTHLWKPTTTANPKSSYPHTHLPNPNTYHLVLEEWRALCLAPEAAMVWVTAVLRKHPQVQYYLSLSCHILLLIWSTDGQGNYAGIWQANCASVHPLLERCWNCQHHQCKQVLKISFCHQQAASGQRNCRAASWPESLLPSVANTGAQAMQRGFCC